MRKRKAEPASTSGSLPSRHRRLLCWQRRRLRRRPSKGGFLHDRPRSQCARSRLPGGQVLPRRWSQRQRSSPWWLLPSTTPQMVRANTEGVDLRRRRYRLT
ncbi:hypothetical protein ACHAWF_005424 [Thalassiosira exigua]